MQNINEPVQMSVENIDSSVVCTYGLLSMIKLVGMVGPHGCIKQNTSVRSSNAPVPAWSSSLRSAQCETGSGLGSVSVASWVTLNSTKNPNCRKNCCVVSSGISALALSRDVLQIAAVSRRKQNQSGRDACSRQTPRQRL